MTSQSFTAFGRNVKISLPSGLDPEFLSLTLLPNFNAIDSQSKIDVEFRVQETPNGLRALRDGENIGQAPGQHAFMHWFSRQVHADLAIFSPTHVFIHSGCVLGPEGQLLVIPGRSYSGKSTLTQALIAKGFAYYSDEYSVLDASGFVHAFPRHMTIRDGASPQYYEARELGWSPSLVPARISKILSVKYHPDIRVGQLQTISKATMVMHLFQNCVSAQIDGARALKHIKKGVDSAQGLAGLRGEASSFSNAILDLDFSKEYHD